MFQKLPVPCRRGRPRRPPEGEVGNQEPDERVGPGRGPDGRGAVSVGPRSIRSGPTRIRHGTKRRPWRTKCSLPDHSPLHFGRPRFVPSSRSRRKDFDRTRTVRTGGRSDRELDWLQGSEDTWCRGTRKRILWTVTPYLSRGLSLLRVETDTVRVAHHTETRVGR